MRSCIENLLHLSHKKENIEDVAHQFKSINSNDLFDKEDLQPVPFPEVGSDVSDSSRVNFASKQKLCGTCSSTYTED